MLANCLAPLSIAAALFADKIRKIGGGGTWREAKKNSSSSILRVMKYGLHFVGKKKREKEGSEEQTAVKYQQGKNCLL